MLLWHTSAHIHKHQYALCLFFVYPCLSHTHKWKDRHNCLLYVNTHTRTHTHTQKTQGWTHTHTYTAAVCGLWWTVRCWKGSWDLTLSNVKASKVWHSTRLLSSHARTPLSHTIRHTHTHAHTFTVTLVPPPNQQHNGRKGKRGYF